MLKFLRVPFAQSGDRATVPDAVTGTGDVSYTEGWGADYSRPKTDPLSKNIPREKSNQLMFDVTAAVGELQSQGIPDFITTVLNGGTPFSYAANAIVRYLGNLYISNVAANTSLPTDATKWSPVFSTTQRGRIDPTKFPFLADPTGATDATAAIAAALAIGPIELRGTFKIAGTITITGKVDILGMGRARIITDGMWLHATDASGSRIRSIEVYPITTPWTIKRNSTTWVNTAADVVQSLEGYVPGAQDTDIYPGMTAPQKALNDTIKPAILFDVSSAAGGTDVVLSDISSRQLCTIFQGYTNSGIQDCANYGGGSLTYGGVVFMNGVNRAYNSAILAFTLPRGSGNFVRNCHIWYSSLCGAVFFGNDFFEMSGNTSRYNGESGLKTYQYDGVAGPSETTAVICTTGKIEANTCGDNFFDGIDAAALNGVPFVYVFGGTIVANNILRRNRHTGSITNAGNMTYDGNFAGNNGTHGLSVTGTSNTVAGNSARNNCTTGVTLVPQVFDIVVQGDNCVSNGNNISNPTAPSMFNYLHSGLSGSPPTSGQEGLDYGNNCDQGASRIAVTTTIPSSKTAVRGVPYVQTSGYVQSSPVVTVPGATYAATDTDEDLSFATTCVLTLPSASAFPGRTFYVSNSGAFALTSANSDIVPQVGGAAGTAILPAVTSKWARLKSNGSFWKITQSN